MRVRLATLRQAFDGLDIFALCVDGENGAAVDGLAVHDDRAGSAVAAIADLLAPVRPSLLRSASSKVTRGSTVRFSRFPFTWRVIGTGPGPTDSEAFWPRALFCRTPAPRVPPRLTPRIKPRRETPAPVSGFVSFLFLEFTSAPRSLTTTNISEPLAGNQSP